MVTRETRLAPSSSWPALRTLGLLTLLAGVVVPALLGLLAQSASAAHTVAPPSISEGASWYGRSTTPTWSFTLTDDTHTASCTLAGPSGDVPVTCTVPAGTASGTATPVSPLPADGAYVLSVTSTRPDVEESDGAATPTVTTHPGGTSAPATSTYTLDRVAPTVTVTPPGADYAASTGWDVAVSDSSPIASTTCTLAKDGGSPSPVSCAPGAVKPALAGDGDYVLTVTATDAAGGATTVSSSAYRYDTTPPAITLTRVTASPSRVQSPEWTYTVTDGGLPSCVLTGPSGPVDGGTCGAGSFTAPTLTASGSYTLTVSSTDAAGNTGTATSTYVLDLTPPGLTISGPTSGTAADTTWNITVSDGTLSACTLTGAGTSTVSCAGSTGTVTASRSTDGSITLTVTAEDAYGNTVTASATYLRSTTPGTPSVSTGSARGAGATITWTVTVGVNTETVTCALTRDGSPASDVPVSCPTAAGTHTVTTTLTTDGAYRLTVTASNSTSPDAPSGSAVYALDTSAPAGPAVTSVHPGTTGSTNPLQWTFAALDGHTVQCRLTVEGAAGAWGACTDATAHTVTPAAQGSHLLSVRYVDDLGNAGAASSSTAYVFDDQAPTAPAVTRDGPAGPRRSGTTVTWQVAAPAEGERVECRLLAPGQTTGSWSTCGTTITRTPSGEGVHTLEVRHVDAADNAGAVTASAVEVDDTPPGAPAVTGPPAGGTTDPQLSWTLDQDPSTPGSTFECLLHRDGAPLGEWTDCGSNYSTTVIDDGTYVLHARAVDVAGNRSATTTSSARTVDRQGPAAPGVTLSPDRGRTKSATWTITPAADATRTECRLGFTPAGGSATTWSDWALCAADGTYPLVQGDGSYALEVRSEDALANRGATTPGPAYVLDATPPDAPAVTGSRTGTGSATSISYAFSGEGTATCRLYRGSTLVQTVADCHLPSPLPVTLSYGDGSYRLEVVLTDAFGNDSEPGVSAAYLLDTAPPGAPTAPGSSGRTTSTTASWTPTHDAADPGTSFECRLISNGVVPAEFGVCAASYPGLVDGTHSLEVRSVDDAGNRSASGFSPVVTVDTTGPDAPQVGLPVDRGRTKSATWTVTPSEQGTTSECRLTRTADGTTTTVTDWTACSSYTFPLDAGDGVYVLTVRTRDALDNLGGATPGPGYTLDATAPDPPAVTGSRTGTDNETALEYGFVTEAGGTATCRLYRGTELVRTVEDCHSTSPLLVDLPRVDGSYELGVVVTDAFGNDSPEGRSEPYVLDVSPPDTPEVTGSRTATDNELTLTYAFTGEGTAVCRLYADGALVRTILDCHTGPQPLEVTLPAQSASYVLTVTFTDVHGNEGEPGSSAAYDLDVTRPGPAGVTVSPRAGNTRTATWTVTLPEPGATTQCRLRKDGVALGLWDTCAAPYAFALVDGDGVYVLEVRVVDAVGNVGDPVLGESHTLDTEAPAVPSVGSDRTVADDERLVTYTFSGEGNATCTLRRDGVVVAGPEGCTSSWTVLLPDVSGSYVLHVTYTDAVGNESDAGTSPVYELDVTAPLPAVVTRDRARTDNERTVTFAFTGEGSATCQLTRDGVAVGEAVECTSPWVVLLPAVDGEYVLLVTLTDAVGNVADAGGSAPYRLDLSGPAAPAVSGPPSTGNSRTVTWSYSGEGSATCTLLRDGQVVLGPFACAPTSHTETLPADGTWTLEVVFTDAVGNIGSVGRSDGYLLDTVAPDAPQAAGPTGPAQGRTPAWTLTGEGGTALECRLVRGGTGITDWAACAGSVSFNLAGLPDGGYSLQVRASDAALNVSAVGSSAPYVLDTTAPVPVAVTGPSGPSRDTRPRFTWSGEPGARAECLLARDGVVVGGWFACTSGQGLSLDRDGAWTLTVRLVDGAGNVGDPSVSNGYLLDTTAPATPVVTPPKTPGRDLAPVWSTTAEPGATLECRFAGETEWRVCGAPHTTPLSGRPDGSYTLEVRATDVAGNTSAIGSGSYVLDTSAPAAAVLTAPTSPGRSRSLTFGLTAEKGATTRCRLSSGAKVLSDFVPCTGPVVVDLAGLPDGTYTLTVRITDEAGNPGPAATSTYVLDTTPPAAPVFTASPASPSPSRSVAWSFTVEPGSTLVCRLTFPTGAVRELTGCTSPLVVDLTGLPDGTYTLVVRAVDAAGNVGLAGTETHVLDASATAVPTIAGPVTPGTSRTPSWRVSGPGTLECRLTRGGTVLRDWTGCSATAAGGVAVFTADLFGQSDGSYQLSARSRDAAGVLSSVATSRYLLDTTGPAAATLVDPPTPSTNRRPTWTVASAELGATAECRVLQFDAVLRDWQPCAVSPAGSPFVLDLSGLGDGAYTLVVRLTDAAGNRGTAEARSTYVLNTAAPVAVGVVGPASPGKDPHPTWQLSTSPGVKLECRLTRGEVVLSDWQPCAAGAYAVDLTGKPDGPYQLTVRAISEAGTPGRESSATYEYKTSVPGKPEFVVRPPAVSNDRAPRWEFTLPPGAVSAVCTVVEGTRLVFSGPCASTGFVLDLSRESQGTHTYTLSVQAVDAAGNRGVAATSSYRLETQPGSPPTFTATPGAVGSTLDPQWRFTVPLGASAQCRLLFNGVVVEDWRACAEPTTHTVPLVGRPDGTYTLQVRTLSAAGNTSEARVDSYRLDRTALPVPVFRSTPVSPGRSPDVAWTFATPSEGRLECRLTGPAGRSAYQDCTTGSSAAGPTGAALTTGRFELPSDAADFDYRLEVRFVDATGAGAPATSSFRLVRVPPPRLVLTDEPSRAGRTADPRWLWEVPEDEKVECRLRRAGVLQGDWADCGSFFAPDLTGLGNAVYTLELRRVDRAGNPGPVTTSSYEYDTVRPDAPELTQRPTAGSDRRPVWTFAVPDGVTATCVVSRGGSTLPGVPCSGRFVLDLTGSPDGLYTVTVRFRDAAGNESSTSSTYTLSSLATGGGGIRVEPQPRPEPAAPVSPGTPSRPSPSRPEVPSPGRGGTSAGGSVGSSPERSTPIPLTDEDLVRGGPRTANASQGRPTTEVPGEQQSERGDATPDVDVAFRGGRLPVDDVPEALRGVVTETFKRPTLPLALLAIVALFLLAQNRIDRRDPKLAAAPVDAEPELDFTAFIRRPGAVS